MPTIFSSLKKYFLNHRTLFSRIYEVTINGIDSLSVVFLKILLPRMDTLNSECVPLFT